MVVAGMAPSSTKKRPFHESVVDIIKEASHEQLNLLAAILMNTAIPKNHREIASAWDTRVREVGWNLNSLDVAADIRSQEPLTAEVDTGAGGGC